jgi:hypothetical protein
MSLLLKKQINKELNDAGFAGMVDISAINKLTEYVQQQGRAEALQEVLQVFQSGENTWQKQHLSLDFLVLASLQRLVTRCWCRLPPV